MDTTSNNIDDNPTWLSRFCPKRLDEFIGFDEQISELRDWISSFCEGSKNAPTKNAVLITGQSGTGKTALAHALVNEYGFFLMETNSSDIRSSDVIKDKLKHVLGGDSITKMTTREMKTAVIMDEIDACEAKDCSISEIKHYIQYARHDYEYRWRVHIRITKKKVSEADIRKKMRDTFFPNKNPIILIANTLTYALETLLKDVIHIHLELPNPDLLFHTMMRIRDKTEMPLSDGLIRSIIPLCQGDYRRAVTIMEDIWSNQSWNKPENEVVEWLHSCTGKDITMPLEDMLKTFFHDPTLSMNDVYKCYDTESAYLPILIYENYIPQLCDKPTSYIDRLDTAISYYDSLIDGLNYKNNTFGKEETIGHYVGYFTTCHGYMALHRSSESETPTQPLPQVRTPFTIEKSKMISKYNHRFCQYRPLYHICKKINCSIHELPILSYLITSSFIVTGESKTYYMEWLADKQIPFVTVEKLFKSSLYYITHAERYYTKKKQKDLMTEYNNVLASKQIYIENEDEPTE
jgi:DNA polymerase III delta prime subunit